MTAEKQYLKTNVLVAQDKQGRRNLLQEKKENRNKDVDDDDDVDDYDETIIVLIT